MRKTTSMAAVGLVTIGMIGLTAPSSTAAFTTRCVGVGGAVTIPGDLVVPAGQSCTLEGTTVQGTVRVQADADLVMTGATVTGDVVVRGNGYLEADDTQIGGAVTARESFGSRLTDSSVGGAVTTINNTEDFGFLIADGSTLGERVRATGGALDLVSSTVAAQVLGLQAEYTDLHDTVVEGVLRVEGNRLGTVVCDSEVYGAAQLRDNLTGVQLGGDRADGGLGDCVGSSYFGSNVNINANGGGVQVVDNIIRGNLSGTGNDPAPVGHGNRVRGAQQGQFAELAPAASRMTAQRSVEADRGEELREVAQQRAEQAEQQAEDAGAAF